MKLSQLAEALSALATATEACERAAIVEASANPLDTPQALRPLENTYNNMLEQTLHLAKMMQDATTDSMNALADILHERMLAEEEGE